MAVINQVSLSLAQKRSTFTSDFERPFENWGKLRSNYAQIGRVPGITYTDARPATLMQASDPGGTIDLMRLPQGNIVLHPSDSMFRTSIQTGTIKFGLREYDTQPNNTVVAEDNDVFTGGRDGVGLSSTNVVTPYDCGNILDLAIWSYKGPILFATFSDAISADDWLEVRIVITQD